MAKGKITKKKFFEALEGSYGVITDIARKMNVCPSAVSKFLDKNSELKEDLEQEKNRINQIAKRTIHIALEIEQQRVEKEATEKTPYLRKDDTVNTRWFLEKKDPEFKSRQEIQHFGELSTDSKIELEIIEVTKNEDELEKE